MTEAEKKLLIEKYPEAAAFAGVAKSVWNGSSSAAKVEMEVKGKLHVELKRLLEKDIKIVFLTDSDIRLVFNEFDKAEHDLTDKMGFKKLLFQKKCGGMIYVATVERGDNKIEVRTLWKMRDPGASC